LFTGRGKPPTEISTTKELKIFLTNNPGAIGYIEKSAVDSSVKVVYDF
jgi:hypothetical protein